MAPLEGTTANTPRVGPVSTSRQRIAELARQAVGMAVAVRALTDITWLPGPAGTRRRVAKLSVEEPDAAEPARPDLWGARVSNDPGLPDPSEPLGRPVLQHARLTAEQWIKEGKQATHWTRLSCHRFRANEVRLQLSVLAYTLGNLWVGGDSHDP